MEDWRKESKKLEDGDMYARTERKTNPEVCSSRSDLSSIVTNSKSFQALILLTWTLSYAIGKTVYSSRSDLSIATGAVPSSYPSRSVAHLWQDRLGESSADCSHSQLPVRFSDLWQAHDLLHCLEDSRPMRIDQRVCVDGMITWLHVSLTLLKTIHLLFLASSD